MPPGMQLNNMRRNKDRIFRFPFDIDTRIFIGLALLFFIFSIKPVQQFLFGIRNIHTVQHRIEEHLQSQIQDAKRIVTEEAIQDIITNGFNSNSVERLLHLHAGLYIYEKDTLLFWNEPSFFPNRQVKNEIYPITNHAGSFVQVQLPTQHKHVGVFLLFPIKTTLHPNENKHSTTFQALNDQNDYGYEIQMAASDAAVPIRVNNTPTFYLYQKNEPLRINDNTGWLLFLCSLPFIFMGISIHTYFKVIVQYSNRIRTYFIMLVVGSVIRALTLIYGFPNNFSEFASFQPELFYHDIINRSLGDTFVNMCLVFWVLLFYIMNIQGNPFSTKILTRHPWLSHIKYIIVLVQNIFIIHLLESMVLNSGINFDTSLFSQVNIQSFIGLLTYMVGMANVLLGSLLMVNDMVLWRQKKWIKYVQTLLLGVLLLFFKPCDVTPCTAYFFMLLSFVLFALMDSKRMRIRFDFNSYELILWIILFSLILAQYLIVTVERREQQQRLALAKSIVSRNELHSMTERIFQIKEGLDIELAVRPYLMNQLHEFKRSIQNQYFSNLPSGYTILIEPISRKNIQIPSHFSTQFNSTKTDSLFIFQNEHTFEIQFYLNPFTDSTTVCQLQLFQTGPQLSNSNIDSLHRTDQNTIANDYYLGIYQDSVLIYNNGYHPIPSEINPRKFFGKKESLFKDRSGYSELWYNHPNQQTTVMLATNRGTLSRFLTLFACLFFIYFSVISLYIFGNILARSNLVKKRFLNLLNINLRLRIHTTIMITMLLAFIVVGYFTIYYLISNDRTNSQKNAIEKIAATKSKLLPVLQASAIAQQTTDTLIKACDALSKDIDEPINLFEYDSGNLIHTTSNLLQDAGFPSIKINPWAFFDLKRNKQEYHSYQQLGEDNDYYLSFSVIQHPPNGTKYIMQMPFNNSKINFRKETFSVIVTLVNTFVIVFLISAIIALLITNSVVQPFTKVVRQFTKINLSQTNEPLSWQYNDEIGLLVREYNRMLRKLENSSMLLARSEREMAWREMAKQVAHEIKNPLTPMKLSLQMLDKAMKENKPNIREMTERVTQTMIEQIDTLSVIATDFSSFARMPENKNEVLLLNDVLKTVTGIYNSNMMYDYDFIIPFYHIHIYADKTQLIRVFTNIIQNAIQSVPTDDHKGEIKLRVKKVADNRVRISISDNGIGIDRERGAKLFEPYFTTKTSGTGLGLAMCKDIIEQIGGNITYESELQVGTTFHVDLSIYDPESVTETTI
jgi:two-component system nitrogen regulation sensor histidine kinase NtrY